jgi:hypothetical protein
MTTSGTSFSKTFNDKKLGKFDDKNLGMTQNGFEATMDIICFSFFKNILPLPLNPKLTLIGHHFIILSIRPLM